MNNKNNGESQNVDICVFIGRFAPLHKGHMTVIDESVKIASHSIILVGSAFEARSFRNPFNYEERKEMIKNVYPQDNVHVFALENSCYNENEWIERVHRIVYNAIEEIQDKDSNFSKNPKISLIGYSKDNTSYYLNLFPMWGSINVKQKVVLSATDIRERIFGSSALMNALLEKSEELNKDGKKMTREEYMNAYLQTIKPIAKNYLEKDAINFMNKNVISFLNKFINSKDFNVVSNEYAYVANYRWSWRFAPYKPTFVTADSVIVQSGHILLIRRRSFPGYGLWAMPGGFVEEEDTILNTALKEIKEETALKVPLEVLIGSIKKIEVFDDPNRSSRGRTITHAHLIHLKPGPLPKIKKGGLADDEETFNVAWIPLAKLKREDFFEDHYSIIKKLTKEL